MGILQSNTSIKWLHLYMDYGGPGYDLIGWGKLGRYSLISDMKNLLSQLVVSDQNFFQIECLMGQ